MRVIGIIAEYNPFHNGHEYLIKKAREAVNDPRAIVMVVMSGPITQRGEVSIAPKHVRTKMALSCGADVVLELPFTFACAPSERFAWGAVELLYRTGVVTDIAFGVDSDNFELIDKIASIDFEADEKYVEALKTGLADGMSYPSARAKAIAQVFETENKDELLNTLHSSNSILALDYLRAIKKLKKNFNIIPVRRIGADYNDSDVTNKFPSATGLREIISKAARSSTICTDLFMKLNGLMPDASIGALLEGLSFNKFAIPDREAHIRNVLNRISQGDLSKYAYMGDSLDAYLMNSIAKVRSSECSYDDIQKLLNTKHFTMPRINRAIISMMVGQTEEFIGEAKHVPYIRVLGFNKDGRYCLKIMGKTARVPVLHNCSDYREIESSVDDVTNRVFELDMRANNYQAALMGIPYNYDWEMPPVVTK